MYAHLDFSKPYVLCNACRYDAVVSQIDPLHDRGRLSSEVENRLMFLTLLVEASDEEHYPMGGERAAIGCELSLPANDMMRADLAPLLGGRSRGPDFFNGRRRLRRDILAVFKRGR